MRISMISKDDRRATHDRRITRCFALLAIGSAACGGEKPSVPEDPADVARVDAPPPTPPSRIGDAQALFASALDVGAIEGALALADALAAESTPEAALAAVRIRLVAVARDAAALVGSATGESKLGPGGAETQLKRVLAGVADGKLAGPDGDRVALAARAIYFALGGSDAEAPDAKALRALEAGQEPEAIALRLALMARYAHARELWETQGFEAFVGAFGPFVCGTCGGGMNADNALGPAVDALGLTCAAPTDASWCEGVLAAQSKDAVCKLAPNALAIATLELARRAGTDGAGIGAALAPLLAGLEPIVLPLPVLLPGEATLGPAGPRGGLGETSPALIVAHLDGAGLQIGVRPVVAPGGAMPAWQPAVALTDAPKVSYEALAEGDKLTGAVAGVTDRLVSVRDATATVPGGWPTAALPGDRNAILLAIAPGVSVDALVKVADGLAAAGPAPLRVLRPGSAGEVLPLHLRTLPPELEAGLVPAWDKSMIVLVGKDALDVWAPEGAKEGAAAIGPEAAASLPTTLQQGWRKDALARLRVPLPPMQAAVERMGPAELAALAEAVKVFSDQAKAGRVVHVVAGDGVSVADVLAVARHLQEVGLPAAPELGRVGEIWPGARCRGDAGCAGAVAVAFSKREVPSARGLSDKPGAGKKEPKEPKEPKPPEPEPGPAPSAQFCNQADIKSQMAKKAGSFRFCYERELQLQKDLEGRLVMNFVIGLPGNVKSVRIGSSDLKNAKVGECIKKEIGKIQFKAPDGGECVVQWPFKFTAN